MQTRLPRPAAQSVGTALASKRAIAGEMHAWEGVTLVLLPFFNCSIAFSGNLSRLSSACSSQLITRGLGVWGFRV